MSRLLSRSHTFAIIVILDLKIHQSMRIHWSFFPKTWTKGHWPLDDLWPHVCWGHMCDSTQGSLCPSPMTIHQCMWIQWSILQNTTYIHTTYYVQNEWSHSLLLNSVQVRQKGINDTCFLSVMPYWHRQAACTYRFVLQLLNMFLVLKYKKCKRISNHNQGFCDNRVCMKKVPLLTVLFS